METHYLHHAMLIQKETKLKYLKKEVDNVLHIDQAELSEKIRSIGFKCKKCAQCCRAEYGDNTVSVFPDEIRRISEKTGLMKEDFAIPAPSEDRDSRGNIHTFEWVLRRKRDCVFLEKGLCRIYECRPYICKTYPFYLLDGRLTASECAGLGGGMNDEESRKLAALLKERYVTEIKETITLLERFGGFYPSGSGVCVHDSKGEHWVAAIVV